MKLLAGLLVGIVVGCVIGYYVVNMRVNTPQAQGSQGSTSQTDATGGKAQAQSACMTGLNRKTAVIEVLNDPDNPGKCKAKVSPACIGNKKTLNVFWVASYDEESQTCASGNWELRLQFANDPFTGMLYNGDQDIKVDRNGSRTKYKLKNTDNAGKFPYVVWFVPPTGAKYPMADPELQIEQ